MDFLNIIILGVVQGIAEFLPISSSGHLVVLSALLQDSSQRSASDVVAVNIVLHFGTLLSILVVYWQRVWRLLFADRRVIGLLFVGSLPAAVVGIALHEVEPLAEVLSNPLLAGCMLLVTAGLLLWSGRLSPGETDYTEMTYRQALVIGLLQAFAILPGVSRSGATIVAGMAVGLQRGAAATFSFLLAIVAIGGAAVLESAKLFDPASQHPPFTVLAVGALVAFVCGVIALRWLLRWLQQGRLHDFAWWCLPVGLLVIAWQLVERLGS